MGDGAEGDVGDGLGSLPGGWVRDGAGGDVGDGLAS